MMPSAALDLFFERYYRQRPVTATFTGVHAHDHRLPDWSPEGLEAAVAEMQDLRAVLDGAGRVPDPQVRAFPEQVDLALADGFLEIQIAEHAGTHFYRGNPALWTGEAIFSVIALVTRDFAPLPERLEAAAARLRAIPRFLNDARRTLTASPTAWRDKAVRECDAAEVLFRQSLVAVWWSFAHLFLKALGTRTVRASKSISSIMGAEFLPNSAIAYSSHL
jgi:hypothetical protein